MEQEESDSKPAAGITQGFLVLLFIVKNFKFLKLCLDNRMLWSGFGVQRSV